MLSFLNPEVTSCHSRIQQNLSGFTLEFVLNEITYEFISVMPSTLEVTPPLGGDPLRESRGAMADPGPRPEQYRSLILSAPRIMEFICLRAGSSHLLLQTAAAPCNNPVDQEREMSKSNCIPYFIWGQGKGGRED